TAVYNFSHAPVAQLDRANASGALGREFESLRARQQSETDMVGRLKISVRADAVRQLFMALEGDAKQIGTCWFCGDKLPTVRTAHRGKLTGNHRLHCPFEALGEAAQ